MELAGDTFELGNPAILRPSRGGLSRKGPTSQGHTDCWRNIARELAFALQAATQREAVTLNH